MPDTLLLGDTRAEAQVLAYDGRLLRDGLEQAPVARA
jgi:hypothetical protein